MLVSYMFVALVVVYINDDALFLGSIYGIVVNE